jgi:hypothetical protein
MIKTTLKNTLLKMEHFLGVIECESITKKYNLLQPDIELKCRLMSLFTLKELTQVFFGFGIFNANIWKTNLLGLYKFAQFYQANIFFLIKFVIYKGTKIS